jgi:hypothetical protein
METQKTTTKMGATQLGAYVDAFVEFSSLQRKPFERKWYDNNFFDDGYHFRYISRTTNKIVDLTAKGESNAPMRAIPKASLQIRGLANLLLQPDYVPVIYPTKVTKANYQDEQMYQSALEAAKDIAKKTGNWITKEWDRQELDDKIIQMVILAAKNYISYIQVWADPVEEKICSQVYDAFEIYIKNDVTDIQDSPMIVKAVPQLIATIKANPNFDREELKKITPDNKYASSEIKNAYMVSKYGTGAHSDAAATLILKEAFIKEYLTDENYEDYVQDAGGKMNYGLKKKGDQVVRQVFVAGGVTLYAKYTNLSKYPFMDFRFEPGSVNGTALIERFIPANKSLDTIVSRIERYANTMVTGTWLKRKGENTEISNIAGGQVLEYESSKPEQAQIASVPGFVFNFIGLLDQFIEEQGASTAALGKLPGGIRSGTAIESIKQTEYANLKIASKQLQKTIKRITCALLEIADNHFITPQTITLLEEGEPTYFDVMGNRGIEGRKMLGLDVPANVVPLKGDYLVDIKVEQGMGFTAEGKKAAMKDVIDFMQVLAQQQLIPQGAINIVAKRFLELYEFGGTAEFTDEMDSFADGGKPMDDQQLMQMKVAVLEALKEAGEVGDEASKKRIMENKVGTVEALKESGLADKINQPVVDNPEMAPLNYKDVPEDIKRQMEAEAGFTPSTSISPSGADTVAKLTPKPVQKGGSNGSKKE